MTCEGIDARAARWQAAAMTTNASTPPGAVPAAPPAPGAAPTAPPPPGAVPAAPLAGPLRRMALGRIVLGAASLAVPGALARGAGIDPSPPLTYMTRIYGARAIALGAGYLSAPAAERPRWQRLGLLVDLSDTATGLRQLLRRESPPRTALPFVALTGAYAALGAARATRDWHSAR